MQTCPVAILSIAEIKHLLVDTENAKIVVHQVVLTEFVC